MTYYSDNTDKCKNYSLKYNELNKIKVCEYQAHYYQRNKKYISLKHSLKKHTKAQVRQNKKYYVVKRQNNNYRRIQKKKTFGKQVNLIDIVYDKITGEIVLSFD